MSPSPSEAAVGFVPAGQIHYMDHLAPVCVMMECPLLFLDDHDFELGKRMYPDLKAERVDYLSFTPEYLIQRCEVIFNSDLWGKKTFREMYGELEKRYQKKMHCIHCPHGFSDKGFYLEKVADEEITLIYGQNMLDLLELQGVLPLLEKYVVTGNLRYTYYKQHRSFYDALVQEEVLGKFDAARPIILYAPTWMDYEESSTFFEADYLFDHLPDDYNMIVKLHPRLELDDIANYYRILGAYERKKNIVFIRDFPPIYPLLAHTDILITDVSSVGYDFLPYNKPMFFLNPKGHDPEKDRRAYLFRCGTVVEPKDFPRFYDVMRQSLKSDAERFTAVRQEVYDYTFGEERSFPDVREEIEGVLEL